MSAINVMNGIVRTVPVGFREMVSASHPTFIPEANRYHLYLSLSCPFAARCYIPLKLKGLDQCISVSICHPTFQKTRPGNVEDKHTGWAFVDEDMPLSSPAGVGSFLAKGCSVDPLNGKQFVRDIYEMCQDTLGRYSVPILFDKKTNTIVNNESADIQRMISNGVFDQWATGVYAHADFCPADKHEEIDGLNDWIARVINSGAYTPNNQAGYDNAVTQLFAGLDRLEDTLSHSRYLMGNQITEPDMRLFPTLVRFDEVFAVYFKCNVKLIREYPNLRNYMRDIYQLPGVADTVDLDHIKMHYYTSHPNMNPFAIVPKGPNVIDDLKLPHNRADL